MKVFITLRNAEKMIVDIFHNEDLKDLFPNFRKLSKSCRMSTWNGLRTYVYFLKCVRLKD